MTYVPQGYWRPKRMNPAEKLFHATLIVCTLGVWFLIYLPRNKSIKRQMEWVNA